jgi:hypothetical protein
MKAIFNKIENKILIQKAKAFYILKKNLQNR